MEKGKHLFILSGQSNMVRLDPEISFIPILAEEFGRENLLVVKDAMGSQSIRRWYKEWESKSGEIPDVRGDLYERLMEKVVKEVQNENIASVTFVWIQGERDARIGESEVYAESLMGVIEQIKQDLIRDEINVVITRLSDFDMINSKWPHWTHIRDIQVEIAKKYPNMAWVPTDDLNDGLDEKGALLVNDLHYSVQGYKTLGERCAQEAIKLIKQKR